MKCTSSNPDSEPLGSQPFLVALDACEHGKVAVFEGNIAGFTLNLERLAEAFEPQWREAIAACKRAGETSFELSESGRRICIRLYCPCEAGSRFLIGEACWAGVHAGESPVERRSRARSDRALRLIDAGHERVWEKRVSVRELFDPALDAYFILDWPMIRIAEASSSLLALFGFELAELQATDPSQLFPQYSSDKLREALHEARTSRPKSYRMKTVMMKGSGEAFEAEVVFRWVENRGQEFVVAAVTDVTDWERVHRDLRKANRTLRILGTIGRQIVRAGSEQELAETVVDRIVSEGEYASAYCLISSPEGSASIYSRSKDEKEDFAKRVQDFQDSGQITLAFQGGVIDDVQVFRSHPRLESPSGGGLPMWRMPRYGSCVVMPVKKEGERIGSLCLFAKETDAFDEDEIALLRELAFEVAFGIQVQRRESARKEAEALIARRLEMETAISQFSHALLKSQDFVDGVRMALDSLAKVSGADHVFVFELANGDSTGRNFVKLCDWSRPGVRETSDIVPGFAINDSSMRFLDSLRRQERVDARAISLPEDLCSSFALSGKSRLVAFPLFGDKDLFGILGFCITKSTDPWDQATCDTLDVAARMVEALKRRVDSDREMRMLATAINSSDEGVVISARNAEQYNDSTIKFVNRGMSQLSGYSEEELLDQGPMLLLRSGIGIENGSHREVSVHQSKLTRKDGSTVSVEAKVYPVFGHSGQIVEFVTILVDITKREEMEAKLAFTNKMESVGQLSAGIAHEINTPSQFVGDNLRFIGNAWEKLSPALTKLVESGQYDLLQADASGGADLLPASKLKRVLDGVPDAIADAIEGTERIGSIVRAMREFSHPQKRMSLVDINKCIETTITIARNEWKYVSELTVDLDSSLPRILISPGDINQVLLNLIVNSAHAIESSNKEKGGRGRIGIVSRVKDERVHIEISDTGCGIPEECRRNVFNPFFTTKEVGKGTGQGLFLAHNIIEKEHGGRIWFESVVGQGTTFHIELPIEEKNDERN